MLIGCYSLSWSISKFRRSKIDKLSIAITVFGGLLSSFGLTAFLLIVFFFVGICIGGDIAISYTILMECLPSKDVNFITLISCGCCIGGALEAVFALFAEI
jgi:uncharacterized membrane protein